MKYLTLFFILFLSCAPDIVPTSGHVSPTVIIPEPLDPITHVVRFEVTTNKSGMSRVEISGNTIFLDCEIGRVLNWYQDFIIQDESDYFIFDFFGDDDGSMTMYHTSIYLDGVRVADWRSYTVNKHRLEFTFEPLK